MYVLFSSTPEDLWTVLEGNILFLCLFSATLAQSTIRDYAVYWNAIWEWIWTHCGKFGLGWQCSFFGVLLSISQLLPASQPLHVPLTQFMIWISVSTFKLKYTNPSPCINRECVRAGAAGARTRRSLGHHLLHPLFWDPEFSRLHLHPQIQILNAFPA